MHQLKKSHYEAAIRVIRYVKVNLEHEIFFSALSVPQLIPYCNSDWVACPMTRKSITDYCIKLGNSLVSWKSKKQGTVSRSSAEAEYRSVAMTVAELVWLEGLLKELGVRDKQCVELYCDNKAIITTQFTMSERNT